jgi:hypothetical protein
MASVIARFAESAKAKDPALLADLMADGVRLHGMRWATFEGKDAVLAVFGMLRRVVDDVEYVAEYDGPNGVVLQLRGTVGDREFDAVHMLRFDSVGLIDEIRDLIRPVSAGTAVLEAVARYLSDQANTP